MNFLLVVSLTLCCYASCAVIGLEDGSYRPELLPYDDGKYHPIGDEGKYFHVFNPYLGGFGRYAGSKYAGGKYLPDAKPKYRKPAPTTPKYDEGGSRIIQQRQGFKDDQYHHFYETENGIFHVEHGTILNAGTDAETIHTKGFYEYTGPDGTLHRVEYSAGEHGFVAKAARLPAPPATPVTPRPVHDLKIRDLVPPPVRRTTRTTTTTTSTAVAPSEETKETEEQ